MTAVFGIRPSQVRTTARELIGETPAVTAAADVLVAGVPVSAALPGGQTLAALVEGADRVYRAVDGEARVLEVLGTDLRSFADVVETAERDAAASLSESPAGVR